MGAYENWMMDIVGVMFAVLTLALILAVTTRNGCRVSNASQGEIALRTSLAMRMVFIMLGLLFTVGTPLLYGAEALDPEPHQKAMPAWGWFAFAILMSLSVPLGALMFYASCPDELFFVLNGRTYRRAYGWPFNRKVETGSLDEMACVYVICVQMNSCYGVGIAWKVETRGTFTLGQFTRSGRADRFAEEMSTALDLPLAEPPPRAKKVAAMLRSR